MVLGTVIPFDLESTPLQIKTYSTTGSGHYLFVVSTHKADGSSIGRVLVWFNSPTSIQYYIDDCISWTTLSVQPSDEMYKVWTTQKTVTALSIECNGVEVLNYQFSDSTLPNCVSQWEGDVVDKIVFSSDSASNSYRVKPGSFGVIYVNYRR